MKNPIHKLQRYDSKHLHDAYQRHIDDMIARPSTDQSDDAFQLTRNKSEDFSSLFKSIMIIGSYPWEEQSQKRILFQYPPPANKDEITQRESFIPFAIPEIKKMRKSVFQQTLFDEKRAVEQCGLNHAIYRTYDSILYKLTLIDNNRLAQPKFVPLYFPSNSIDCPFTFCFYFYCSAFNMPSFCHNFTMNDLSKHVIDTISSSSGHFNLKITRLAMCIQTTIPFHNLFKNFFEWILSCELYTRMKNFQHISDFCDSLISGKAQLNENPFPAEIDWLKGQQLIMNELIQKFFRQPFPPTPNDSVTVEHPPFTTFHWQRPNSITPFFSLATIACKRLVHFLQTPEKFVKLFFSLLLEHSIIVYSDDVSATSWFILCLHLLIRPLKWTLPSISLVPFTMNDFIDSPISNILGITTEFDEADDFENIPKSSFYIDLKRSIFLPPSDLLLTSSESTYNFSTPFIMNFMRDIETVWNCDMGLVLVSNKFVSTFLEIACSCIITCGVNPSKIYSKFMEEKFLLENFSLAERPLAHDICKSQMFRFYIEQQCRAKTEKTKKTYKRDS